jgi:hypothetical protein
MPLSTDEDRDADETKVEPAFWSPKQFADYRNCSPGKLRRERIDGTGAPFQIDDAGHIRYPVGPAKEHASRKPLFNSRAEVYAAHPALAERDERQAEVTAHARTERWTARTRERLARKSHSRPAAKVAASQS